MNTAYRIVIPARMASERLPGKPLLPIAGRSLLEHVWRRAKESAAEEIVIATDSGEILESAHAFGARAVLTSPDHSSGSDRIAECAEQLGWSDDSLLVNLQGDEPLMPPACLDQAAELLRSDAAADVASLYWPIADAAEVDDPNAVKVVVGLDGAALYFSRAPVPHPRGLDGAAEGLAAGIGWNRHIGLYAYRVGALRAFTAWNPTPLEQAEKLEQLRFLEHGRRIVMAKAAERIPAGVDTPEDLRRVRALMEGQSGA